MTHLNPFLQQVAFRGYADDGAPGSATAKATENTGWTQAVDENFRVRYELEERDGGTENNVQVRFQYNLGGAGWNDITTTSSVVKAVASPHYADEDADTVDRLTTSAKTFIDGILDETGLCGQNNQIDFAVGNEHWEPETCLQIVGADVNDSDTIELRMVRDTASLEAWLQTPSITVSKAAAGIEGTLSATLAALTLSAIADLLLTGTLTRTLGDVVASATGQLPIVGQAALTLGDVTLDAEGSGSTEITGALDATLGDVTLTGSGALLIEGAADSTLGAVTISAAGQLPVTGSADATLGAVVLEASGVTTTDITGALDATLGDVTASAQGSLLIDASAAIVMSDVISDASGALAIDGALTATLDAITLDASGTSSTAVTGVLDVTLADVTGAATGELLISGQASAVLDAISMTGNARLFITGSAAYVMEDVLLTAVGGESFQAIARARGKAKGVGKRGKVKTNKTSGSVTTPVGG